MSLAQLAAILRSVGLDAELRRFERKNEPLCHLISVRSADALQIWHQLRLPLQRERWHAVMVRDEADLDHMGRHLFDDAPDLSESRQQVDPDLEKLWKKTPEQQKEWTKEQLDNLMNSIPKNAEEFRKQAEEYSRRAKEEGRGSYFDNEAYRKTMENMTDEDVRRHTQFAAESMTSFFSIVFGVPDITKMLKALNEFESPTGPPKSAVECISLAENMDPLAWFSLKKKLDKRYDKTPEGEWYPLGAQTKNVAPYSVSNREFVSFLIVPTVSSWNVPAILGFGGWNDCPPPQVQSAVLRRWHKMYGAEILGLGRDILDLYIAKPITNRTDALSIAKEHYIFCSDVCDQGYATLGPVAAEILDSHIWRFWWD